MRAQAGTQGLPEPHRSSSTGAGRAQGRPEEDRAALARAFIAKAVFDVPTTRGLIERLEVDGRLCRLCGWSGAGRLPSEATFSRAFSEFAESRLAKVLAHLMFGMTVLTASQLKRLIVPPI